MQVKKNYQTIVIIWMLLFVFQSLLTKISSIFSYIDEAPLLIFFAIMLLKTIRTGKITSKRENRGYIIALIIFVLTGLAGNVLYQYQPWNLVITDLITNLKFFGAIAFFSMWMDADTLNTNRIPSMARFLTVVLTILFLLGQFTNIFPSKYRYGIKVAVLFYEHPTYLAGICVFLIAIMTIYGAEKSKLYIAFDLIILAFTLRSKAIAGVAIYILLYIVIKKLHAKLTTGQIFVVGLVGIICAWSQIYFYFISLGGKSARSVMLLTSITILKDYFPIGTGFATFASHSAAVNYSPVYTKYGFELIYELRNSATGTFFDDQFWPIILGQTGAIGTVCYVYVLFTLFKKIQRLFNVNLDLYMSALFVFIYLLISSIAEPAFNNSVAIPLAMTLTMAMKMNFVDYDNVEGCD